MGSKRKVKQMMFRDFQKNVTVKMVSAPPTTTTKDAIKNDLILLAATCNKNGWDLGTLAFDAIAENFMKEGKQ